MRTRSARTALLFGLLVITSVGGACGEPDADAPRLVVEGEPVAEFGALFADETRRHVFTLRNAGRRPLKIHRVRKDCGCTQPLLSRAEIPPGEEATLTVDFRPPVLGTVAKRIWVFSNDPAGELVLRLQAEGQGIARLEPRVIRLPEIHARHPDGRIPLEVEVSPQRSLQAVTFAPGQPGLEIRSAGPPEGRRARFVLELPRFREPGSLRDTIPVFVTVDGDPNPKRLPLPLQILGEARPSSWTEPAALHLGAGPPSSWLEAELTLHAPEATRDALRPRWEGEAEGELVRIETGRWRLRLRLPEARGRVLGRVVWERPAADEGAGDETLPPPMVPVHAWCGRT